MRSRPDRHPCGLGVGIADPNVVAGFTKLAGSMTGVAGLRFVALLPPG